MLSAYCCDWFATLPAAVNGAGLLLCLLLWLVPAYCCACCCDWCWGVCCSTLSQRQMVASSHTVMRMFPLREKAVWRIGATHLGWVRVEQRACEGSLISRSQTYVRPSWFPTAITCKHWYDVNPCLLLWVCLLPLVNSQKLLSRNSRNNKLAYVNFHSNTNCTQNCIHRETVDITVTFCQ